MPLYYVIDELRHHESRKTLTYAHIYPEAVLRPMYPRREPRTLTEEEISIIRGLNFEPFSQVVSAGLESHSLTRLTHVSRLQDPWGCVWVVKDKDGEMYMAKSILKVSYEMLALQKLRSLPSPRNITIPGRIYECSNTYIFLMPFLSRLEDLIRAPNVSWMHLLSYFDTMIDVCFASVFVLPSTH